MHASHHTGKQIFQGSSTGPGTDIKFFPACQVGQVAKSVLAPCPVELPKDVHVNYQGYCEAILEYRQGLMNFLDMFL